jgi:membrane protein
MRKWFNLLKATYNEWSDDNCLRLGAALSFYTLGSLIPLLLVITSLTAFFILFTPEGQNIKDDIITYIATSINQGPNPETGDPSEFMRELQQATQPQEGQRTGSIISTIVGFVTLLFTASGVFGQLYESMNIIFDVPESERPQGIWAFVRSKVTAFALVIGVALLLLVSIILSSTLARIIDAFGLSPAWLVSLVTNLVTFCIIAFAFAMLFKYLPDIDLPWSDVLRGGLFTAVLWFIGQYALSFYFAESATASSYGIIGAVLAFLVYVYYASQILFMGAEFTDVYSRQHGSRADLAATGAQGAAAQGITPQAALVATTVMTTNQQRLEEKNQKISEVKSQRVAAAATGSILGLVLGAALGGVALVLGIARGLSRLGGSRT